MEEQVILKQRFILNVFKIFKKSKPTQLKKLADLRQLHSSPVFALSTVRLSPL